MKFEELLKKQGLSDEQITAITGAMSKEKIYTTTLENAEVRYNKLKDDKKEVDTQLTSANNTITSLKKYETDNEDLKGKISTYETEKANYEKALKDKDFNYALDKALGEYKVKNSKLVKALLDNEKLKVDGDSVIGLKEQIEAIQKDNDFLFEKAAPGGAPDFIPGGKGDPNTGNKSLGEKLGEAKASALKTNQNIDKFFN